MCRNFKISKYVRNTLPQREIFEEIWGYIQMKIMKMDFSLHHLLEIWSLNMKNHLGNKTKSQFLTFLKIIWTFFGKKNVKQFIKIHEAPEIWELGKKNKFSLFLRFSGCSKIPRNVFYFMLNLEKKSSDYFFWKSNKKSIKNLRNLSERIIFLIIYSEITEIEVKFSFQQNNKL
jgi:hypothetical protein